MAVAIDLSAESDVSDVSLSRSVDVEPDTTLAISVDGPSLAKALRVLKPALLRDAVPVVADAVHVQTQGDWLVLTVSDGTVFARTRLCAVVHHAGAALLPVARTLAALKGARQVTLRAAGAHAELKIASAVHRMATGDLRDYPIDPDMHGAAELEFDAGELREGLRAVGYAISADETRPHLAALCIEHDADHTVRVIATDGHRIARHAMRALPVTADDFQPASLVPSAAVRALRRMLEQDRTSSVSAKVLDGRITFEARRGVSVSAPLVEAAFPAYQSVYPTSYERSAVVDRDASLAVLATVVAVAPKQGAELTVRDGAVGFRVEHPDAGSASASVDATTTGTTLRIGVSIKYLREALESMPRGEVTLEFNEALDPISVRAGETHALVMPMRI